MERIDLSIPGTCILRPKVLADHRGFFMETYNKFRMNCLNPQVGFLSAAHEGMTIR